VINGYEEMHPVGIEVRADMLETAAGFPNEERVDLELVVAMATIDIKDPTMLRWLATVIAAKLDYLNEEG
jgi:hypothetical protein